MSDMSRLELLATIRTDEPISEHRKQLRWFFMRQIVVRAYVRNYKHSYNDYRAWWDSVPYTPRSVTSYDLELTRIIELYDHIKHYRFNVSRTKPREGFSPQTAAVILSLTGYYQRFREYDCQIHLEEKGVGFTMMHNGNYGGKGCKRVRYSQGVNIEKYLRAADWDVADAMRLWIDDKNAKYEYTLEHGHNDSNPQRNKRPTVAMIVGMYARMQRHAAVRDVAMALSLDGICTEIESNKFFDLFDLSNAQPAVCAMHDFAQKYRSLVKQSQKVAGKYQ